LVEIFSNVQNNFQNETVKSELCLATEKLAQLEMEISEISGSLEDLQSENRRLKQELEEASESAANQLQEVI